MIRALFPQSKPTQRLALLDTRLASAVVLNKQETWRKVARFFFQQMSSNVHLNEKQ